MDDRELIEEFTRRLVEIRKLVRRAPEDAKNANECGTDRDLAMALGRWLDAIIQMAEKGERRDG